MQRDIYEQHPALRPTVLVGELTKTIYLPTLAGNVSQIRPDAIIATIARETPRAA